MISIIIPLRFRPDLVKACLDSVFENTKSSLEIIIVQDGVDSEMEELIKKYTQISKRIYHEKPLGYVKAINAGFEMISSESTHVMFLNSDTVCIPNWLDEMLVCFDKYPDVGLVAPTLTAWNGVQSIEFNKQYGDYQYVDEVIGTCMLFKIEALRKLMELSREHKVVGNGILDERYGLGGGDDNDICMRISLAGYKTMVARKSFIYHYISASFRKLFNDDEAYSKKYSTSVFAKFKEKFKKELKHKIRVFISVPCSDGSVYCELAMRLLEWSHDPNINLSIKYYPNLSPLDNARNRAVKDFLEDYYDYFMHIDNDIIPPTNALQVLLGADKDVIAPLCFTMKQDDSGYWFPMIVAHKYNKAKQYEQYIPIDDPQGVHETDIVTGGCHLVRREVMEKLERPYYFTYHKNGIVEYSEDFVFSQQCQKLGYKLFTHYGLPCKHMKVVDVKSINDLLVKNNGT
jgi:GT2 family glycosyltransferase